MDNLEDLSNSSLNTEERDERERLEHTPFPYSNLQKVTFRAATLAETYLKTNSVPRGEFSDDEKISHFN